MQAYDLIMLIVIGMATIFGAIKGFAWQVASLASIIISYLVAYRFRYDVAEMIQAKPPWNQFLAMLILYVGTSFVIWVGFRLLSTSIDRVRLKEFDRHLGAAFGLAKGLVYCLLITMFATSLLGPNQQAAICHSRSGYYIAKALDNSVGVLPKEIHDVVGPYLAKLDEKLKNGGAFGDSTGIELGGSLWPSSTTAGLEPNRDETTGFGNFTESLQTGIRSALPHLLPGAGDGNSSIPNLPGNWNQNGILPSFEGGNLNPGNFLPPPAAGTNFGQPPPPQVFPPLGSAIEPPNTYGQSNFSSGLRPSIPPVGQQAQQPSMILPR